MADRQRNGPTIRDVARLAGVAPITVSRVINGTGYASDITRERVNDAIRQLQYVPNRLAQSLRFNRTDTIALLLSDITNPFWTTLTRGVEDAFSRHGISVLLCNTDENPVKTGNYVDVLLQRQTDGFLLVPAGDDPAAVRRIQAQGVPVVTLDRPLPGLAVDTVRSDSVGGVRALSEHLIAQGHRDIGIITGPPQIATSGLRLEGYKQALAAHGIPFDPSRVLHGEYNMLSDHNVRMARRLMAQPVTALIAGNNFIAVGVLKAMHQTGVQVPEDISIVSFDDLPQTFYEKPFLTVATQSPYEMGKIAANRLWDLMQPDADTAPQITLLPVQLIERTSVRTLTPDTQGESS